MEKIKYAMMFQEVKLESMRAIEDKLRFESEYGHADENEKIARTEIYENIIELIATLKPSK